MLLIELSMLMNRVAELAGTIRKAIRHYESIGLIKSPERECNYRMHGEHDVMVIGMICRAKALGFSFREIQDIVSTKSQGKKLPVDLVFQLINKKILHPKQEIVVLSLRGNNLNRLK